MKFGRRSRWWGGVTSFPLLRLPSEVGYWWGGSIWAAPPPLALHGRDCYGDRVLVRSPPALKKALANSSQQLHELLHHCELDGLIQEGGRAG
eukprot:scaffold27010_cov129-Isochrysis_galbana.AAC.1